MLRDDCSNNDELFVFEHDSYAWICKRQAISSLEEAGDKVLATAWGWHWLR
jgi:hypothetical protein